MSRYMKFTYFLTVLILGGGLLAGCGQAKVPQDHYYRMDLAAPARMEQPLLSGTLAIKRFAADGMLQARGIVYSQPARPLEVESYHYHHWTDIPPVMLQELLVGYLRAANVAPSIVAGGVDVEPDYILKGRIKRLERVIGSSSEGIFELELSLIQANSRRVVLHRSYRQQVRADNQTVAGTVAALNQALAKVYAEFLSDLTALKSGS